MHHRAELVAVAGAGLQRAAVDDDDGGALAVGGLGPAERDGLAGEQAGAVAQIGRRRHLLDRELHGGQLPAPAGLEAVHGVQDEVVEAFAAGLGDRHVRGRQGAAHAPPVAVAPAGSGVFRVPGSRAQLRVCFLDRLAWRSRTGGKGGNVVTGVRIVATRSLRALR
nr:hypothetical protein GCM10020093_092930 [Planobispora longispora]